MKIEELRGKTQDELNALLVDLKKESFNLRFQKTTGELENTSRIREVRRTVATIKTLQNEEKLGISRAPAKKVAKKAAPKKAAAKAEPKKAEAKATETKKAAPKKAASK